MTRDRGFKKGDLKFTLHGDKLHGSWVLVRMKGDRYGGKRTNWLLIKHRDEFVEGRRRQRHPGRGSLRGFRANHGADCARQGQGAEAVHAGQGQDKGRRSLALEPRRSGRRARRQEDSGVASRAGDEDACASANREAEESFRDAGFRRAAALRLRRAAAEFGRLVP